MHPNPVFRSKETTRDLNFAREQGYGLLVTEVLGLAHVPFVLAQDGGSADLHLLRSNPVARAASPQAGALVVEGPYGYISPDWYGVEDQVPTWNYVAMHLRGRLERLPDEELSGVLDALSDHFEAKLDPKPRWTTGKMTPEIYAKMKRAIVPFRFWIEDVQATWKLNQNKPEEVRLRAAEGVAQTGNPALADLMRVPPKL